jgi:hypothetical protein
MPGITMVQALGIDPNDRKPVMRLSHALFAAKDKGRAGVHHPGHLTPERDSKPGRCRRQMRSSDSWMNCDDVVPNRHGCG